MKKIEEAAFEIYPVTGEWRQDTTNADRRMGFKAGARYVLDAMTSDAAVKAFADAVEALDDQDIDATPLEEISTALCAVRKEIEGE